jgi:large subunit ribosomal protein L2
MKHLKPITNSSRNTVLTNYKQKLSSIVKKYPKKLFVKLNSHSGRNNQGVITTRHQGGGHKKLYRIVDFKRYSKDGIEGTVKSIEYDPYRNCFISFIAYKDGTSSFILSPIGLKIGDKVLSGLDDDFPIKVGNNTSLKNIPVGTDIHNIELKPLKGGQLARSAGTCAQIIGKEDGRYILVRLGSKEVRKILASCRATIGRVGNEEHSLIKLGKAGRSR